MFDWLTSMPSVEQFGWTTLFLCLVILGVLNLITDRVKTIQRQLDKLGDIQARLHYMDQQFRELPARTEEYRKLMEPLK